MSLFFFLSVSPDHQTVTFSSLNHLITNFFFIELPPHPTPLSVCTGLNLPHSRHVFCLFSPLLGVLQQYFWKMPAEASVIKRK